MSNFDRSKLSSGKFWLTVIAGFVFSYVARHKIISAEATVGILVGVFTHYFTKDKNGKSDKPV